MMMIIILMIPILILAVTFFIYKYKIPASCPNTIIYLKKKYQLQIRGEK